MGGRLDETVNKTAKNEVKEPQGRSFLFSCLSGSFTFLERGRIKSE